jgi:hypothetical protein
LISALILSLRSVSFAMLALSFAVALAVLETGAFVADALATGFTAFAGAVTFFGVAAAFGAGLFAVAIFKFPFLFNWLDISPARYCLQYWRSSPHRNSSVRI